MLCTQSINRIITTKIIATKPHRTENLLSRNIFIRALFVSAFSNTFLKQVMSWRCSGQTNEELVGNLKSKFNLIIYSIKYIYQ